MGTAGPAAGKVWRYVGGPLGGQWEAWGCQCWQGSILGPDSGAERPDSPGISPLTTSPPFVSQMSRPPEPHPGWECSRFPFLVWEGESFDSDKTVLSPGPPCHWGNCGFRAMSSQAMLKPAPVT